MPPRDSKKLTVPPRPRSRTTRRGLATSDDNHAPFSPLIAPFSPLIDAEDLEPVISTRPTRRELELAHSTRPTHRDLAVPSEATKPAEEEGRGMRGQYSISSVRGIPTDVVAGSIDNTRRKLRRSTGSIPAVRVHLANVTKRELTVIVRDQPLTLSREDALALASIIQTAFS